MNNKKLIHGWSKSQIMEGLHKEMIKQGLIEPKREWVGLSYEEAELIVDEAALRDESWFWFVKQIEAKLKEKNT